jgi:hypothetical protein
VSRRYLQSLQNDPEAFARENGTVTTLRRRAGLSDEPVNTRIALLH